MPDISQLLLDPDLAAVPFTVDRTTYRRTRGTLTPTTQTLSAFGCIHPGTPEMLQLMPEEERHETFIAIHTSFRLTTGENASGSRFQAADRVHYAGRTWRVVRVRDWPAFDYVQALAVLLDEEPPEETPAEEGSP